MKHPNGYGTVTRLSGNRRRPYIVKEGMSGKQAVVGYTATREEALILLAEYNRCPWNIRDDRMTFSALYDMWRTSRAPRLSASTRAAMQTAYGHCVPLYYMQYRRIKAYHMQRCIDLCGRGYATQAAIRNLFCHLDRLARELDIIQNGYATLLVTASVTPAERTVFSEEELARLWARCDTPYMDTVLFLLYTGFRVSEMLALRTRDVNSDAKTVRGGTKTAAGKNRIVPIHPRILPFLEKRLAGSASGYLFEYNGKRFSMTQYRRIWNALMETLGMHHTPHECRHTFRSRLDSVGANKVCIDRMMGHASQGTGERVYTHKTVEELRRNLELITD